jgi:hypothetical protein
MTLSTSAAAASRRWGLITLSAHLSELSIQLLESTFAVVIRAGDFGRHGPYPIP